MMIRVVRDSAGWAVFADGELVAWSIGPVGIAAWLEAVGLPFHGAPYSADLRDVRDARDLPWSLSNPRGFLRPPRPTPALYVPKRP